MNQIRPCCPCSFFVGAERGKTMTMPSSQVDRGRLQKKARVEEFWHMPWTEFEVLLGELEPTTMRSLNVHTLERAARFLRNCGFDPNDKNQRMRFEQFFAESVFFIRHVLLSVDERNSLTVPEEIRHLEDPCRLLVLASDLSPKKRYKRLWAMAIVKVIFAIMSLEHNDKVREISSAKNQIFSRIRDLIVSDGNDTCLQFRGVRLPLRTVDWKESKTRTSIILKLLHKPESVVDEVFDYFGVRFVAKKASDLPHLLRLLIDSDIIIPQQILTIRTRNTLVTLDKAKRHLDILQNLLSTGVVDPDEFETMCRRIGWTFTKTDEVPRHQNIFSSERYRALQLTVRHLVRLPNPAFLVVNSLSQQVRHYRGLEHDDSDLSWLVPREIVRYFPIEIQVLDSKSYDVAQFGPASHERYKASQLRAVRERVLGGLLRLSPDRMGALET